MIVERVSESTTDLLSSHKSAPETFSSRRDSNEEKMLNWDQGCRERGPRISEITMLAMFAQGSVSAVNEYVWNETF